MRIPRIYTPQPLSVRTRVQLDTRAAGHVRRVLRMRAGASLRLFNGDGREYGARIVNTGDGSVETQTVDVVDQPPPGRPRFTLIQGIAKGDRMDYALQKAVELGVHRIIPAMTAHSVVKLDHSRLARRMEHWRGILISASEQCGRCRLPHLDRAADLQAILDRTAQGPLKLVLEQRAEFTLRDFDHPEDDVLLLVGPEGGLSGEELGLARDRGFVPLRLGPRILRTETAPLAALAALQALWGDLR